MTASKKPSGSRGGKDRAVVGVHEVNLKVESFVLPGKGEGLRGVEDGVPMFPKVPSNFPELADKLGMPSEAGAAAAQPEIILCLDFNPGWVKEPVDEGVGAQCKLAGCSGLDSKRGGFGRLPAVVGVPCQKHRDKGEADIRLCFAL